MVKGAYKENESIAFQSKEDVDANYIKIIEQRLLSARNFTSIATHDHRIINHVKQFMKENHIEKIVWNSKCSMVLDRVSRRNRK